MEKAKNPYCEDSRWRPLVDVWDEGYAAGIADVPCPPNMSTVRKPAKNPYCADSQWRPLVDVWDEGYAVGIEVSEF